MIKTCDIFCKIVDNYGDVGVCWRLVRQLAGERGIKTRLFIDRPDMVDILKPNATDKQNVDIIRWDNGLIYTYAADLVIEAFACTLPDPVIAAMKASVIPPVWVDLEYLSTESWVDGFHAIPSQHPTTGLTKTVFFPGFSQKTGGLLREFSLLEQKNSFLSDIHTQNTWRKNHFMPDIDSNCIDISLFCYKTAPEVQLLQQLSDYHRPVRVFKPALRPDVMVENHASLTMYHIPFLTQKDYDYFLWTCDLNFVRGEDSCVRGQFAGKPMLWNIYVQDSGVHLIKLEAFLELYAAYLTESERDLLAECHNLWNEGGRAGSGNWHKMLDSLPQLTCGAQKWADFLSGQDDLVTQLLTFAATQRQHREIQLKDE